MSWWTCRTPNAWTCSLPSMRTARRAATRRKGKRSGLGQPVQFIPIFSTLTREALEQAETADFEGLPLRVVRADHLAVVALSVGRAKDLARIVALLESGATNREEVARLAEKHALAAAWKRFERRFLDE